MSLRDNINRLRDQVLVDLNSGHDYYTDTKLAWQIVRNAIQNGHTFSIQNTITGTLTSDVDLAGKARQYVAEHLAEATFQQFISIFENFLFDLLRLWLMEYPRSLSGKKVDFRTILDAPDKDALTFEVVSKEVNEVLYERPAGWFAYLNEKANLGCPLPVDIDRIAEAKASRDVLVHNRGIANKTYEAKAGPAARFKNGERIEISEQYHREIWELLRKVTTDISNAAIAKVS